MSPAERHRKSDVVNGEGNMVQRKRRMLSERRKYLLGEQSLHRGKVSAVVISLQAIFFLT